MEIAAPSLEYLRLLPLILLFAGGCLGVLMEAALPRRFRWGVQLVILFASILGSLAVAVLNWWAGSFGVSAMGSVVVDRPGYFAWVTLLVLGLLSALLMVERTANGGVSAFAPQAGATPGSADEALAIRERVEHTEIFPLLLFALFGMMMFATSGDLITMFVALEIFSLPLYLLCGVARRRRLLSQEAALKYFLLGALASAFFLFGTALLFGYSGSFDLSRIAQATAQGGPGDWLLLAGLGLVSIGLLFKVGAVPFHAWTPDVYQGAPTAVTAFMAACTKVAAVAALLRVLYVGLGGLVWTWQPLIATIAVLTMLVGALVAITQTDVKRLLAYSSIAHAGFILTAVVGAVGSGAANILGSVGAVLFYLVVYGLGSIGAFALITLVRDEGGEVTDLSRWGGLGRRHPVLGAAMTLLMLSFAGIPLTAGFIGKVVVFETAWRGGYPWLVVVGMVASLVAAYLYLKVIVTMYFGTAPEPVVDTQETVGAGGVATAVRRTVGQVQVVRASVATYATVAITVVATLVLGIVPGPLLDLAARAGEFLR